MADILLRPQCDDDEDEDDDEDDEVINEVRHV